jgi:hypothetical protein
LATVHHAHQAGIVHRDIKPGNVLLVADGTPMVADFGLARRLDGGRRLTQSGAILGTPGYMAPEQAGRASEVGPEADVYALGAILYECLTGLPPFRGATVVDKLVLAQTQRPEPPSRVREGVPEALDAICLRCLERDKQERYGSAEALAQALERLLAGKCPEPALARRYDSTVALARDLEHFEAGDPILSRPEGRVRRLWRKARRHRAALLGALAGVAALIVIAFLLAPGPDTVPAQVRVRPVDAYVAPRGYLCYRAASPPAFAGRLDEGPWKAAPWTEDFVDIEGERRRPPRFRTRAKMLWDERYYYIAAELQESHVWGTLTKHDSVIYHDNDFEVMIDPDGDNHNYAELELNTLNTTWDLLLPKPYRDGGRALNEWDITGLKTAVHVNGTLNDPQGLEDRGWTVEIAIPWEPLARVTEQPVPPRDGDQWRVNFSRVEWRTQVVEGKYSKVPGLREDNWVWSPQGVVDMHRPEKWGYVQFSTADPGTATFRPDPAGPAKHLLQCIYYAQGDFRNEHDRYAQTLAELGLADLTLAGPLSLQEWGNGYQATAEVRLRGEQRQRWHIREDSRVWADAK